jgi:hypothetical protein
VGRSILLEEGGRALLLPLLLFTVELFSRMVTEEE